MTRDARKRLKLPYGKWESNHSIQYTVYSRYKSVRYATESSYKYANAIHDTVKRCTLGEPALGWCKHASDVTRVDELMDTRQNVDVQMRRRQHGAQHYGTAPRSPRHHPRHGASYSVHTHTAGENYRYAFFRLEEWYNKRRNFLPSLDKFTFTIYFHFVSCVCG